MVARGVPHPVTITGPDEVAAVPGPWVVKPRAGRGSRGAGEDAERPGKHSHGGPLCMTHNSYLPGYTAVPLVPTVPRYALPTSRRGICR